MSKPIWEEIEEQEFHCNIHDCDVADEQCTCPAIEVWAEADYWPYEMEPTDEIRAWVKENPFSWDD